MADTRQVVEWSLERPCPFRTGDGWPLPGRTAEQLGALRTVASAEGDGRNVDGVCVTGWTTEQDNAGTIHDVPHSGFDIAERLGPAGGLSLALATCGGCEANARTDLAVPVAGCFGHLDRRPDSEELDEQLRGVIRERGLGGRFRALFPATTPLWYGLWVTSPLGRAQAELLHELFTAVCDPADPGGEDVRHFVGALDAAVRWELPVHVSLAPLGHTDFGQYTVFPHCPRCKANARVGRWLESYPTDPHDCRACGHTFVPDDNQSSGPDGLDWGADRLEDRLGKAGHERFIRTFLVSRGCTPEQADEVIDNRNSGPLLRRIRAVRLRRDATLERVRRAALPRPDEPTAETLRLADGVGMEFVPVPAGEFLMGSSDADGNPNESPQHPVRIARPFLIGRSTVTQAEWAAVMDTDISKHRGDPRLPVDRASWLDAQAFCEKLCERFGRPFRLPTEAEWEYCCRAGTTTKYAFGETLSPDRANFTPYATMFGPPPGDEEGFAREMELAAERAEAGGRREARPVPVGGYRPNAWGLCDTHGNVDEWCEDVWHPTYAGAPADGAAWLAGEDTEPFRVVRGGWASATELVCTSSARRALRADAGSRADHDAGDDEDGDDGGGFLAAMLDMLYRPYGFRVVCEWP